MSGRRVIAVVAAVSAALFIVVAITLVVSGGDRLDRCSRSPLLVPSCGVLWGVATDPNTQAAVDSVESATRTRFDMVYRFHDLNDRFPTADERTMVADGRVLHVTVTARIFGSARVITWREITDGLFDHDLGNQARGIAALGVPVFVTFDHEPDRTDRAVHGSPADFISAWRHVHDLYARNGARNAVWVWVVTGYPPFFEAAARTWPGNDYVDWIGWEAYNGSGCASGAITPLSYKSFATAALRFYRWVHAHGSRYGIDADKPMMISEAASVVYPTMPARTAQWYAGIPSTLARYRQIRAVTLWDRPGNGGCRYRFDDVPGVPAAIGSAGALVHYPLLFTPSPER